MTDRSVESWVNAGIYAAMGGVALAGGLLIAPDFTTGLILGGYAGGVSCAAGFAVYQALEQSKVPPLEVL